MVYVKNSLTILLCMLLFPALALGEPYIILYSGAAETAGCALMLDEDGELLTTRGAYQNIYDITQGNYPTDTHLYAAMPLQLSSDALDISLDTTEEIDYYAYSRVALMDAQGHQLTDFDYLNLLYYPQDDVIVFANVDNRKGIMSTDGSILHEAEFAEILPNGQGGYLVLVYPQGVLSEDNALAEDGVAYPLYYLDEKGRSFDTGYHSYPYYLESFSEGFARISNVVEVDGQSIYLNAEGTNVFDRSFYYSDRFYGDCAAVVETEGGYYGLIDVAGNYVVEPEYEFIFSGSTYGSNVFIGYAGNRFAIFDSHTGEIITEKVFDGVSSLSIWLESPTMLHIYADASEYIYDTQNDRLIPSNDDIFCWYRISTGIPQRMVKTVNEWPYTESQLIDMEGNAIGPAFQGITAAVWQGNKGRFITESYRIFIDEYGSPNIDWNSYRYGLCDQDGSILLDMNYLEMQPLSLDRYWVRLGGRCGMIDSSGKWYFVINDYESLMD